MATNSERSNEKPPTLEEVLRLHLEQARQIEDLQRQLDERRGQTPAPTPTDGGVLKTVQGIARDLSTYTAFQATAFDKGGSGGRGSTGGGSFAQIIERASAQVLGRATLQSGENFVSSLTDNFPTLSDGRSIAVTPTRSIVSLYGAGGSSASGTLSTRQANLYREARLLVQDGLTVLAGLQPFLPDADAQRVEARRAAIRNGLQEMLTEFGRVDRPRDGRVTVYLRTLKTNLDQFGVECQFCKADANGVPIRDRVTNVLLRTFTATVDDEAQVAGYELLVGYRDSLEASWNRYRTSSTDILSENLNEARILLPIIAIANQDFEDALDSLGFGESERRSSSANLQNSVPSLPNITIYDLTDWIDRLATIEGPNALDSAGRFGLADIAAQAQSVAAIVGGILQADPDKLVWQLSTERAHLALRDLQQQLGGFAVLVKSATVNP